MSRAELTSAALGYLHRISKNKFDTDSWIRLMNEICSVKISIARQHYEKFFSLFSTSGRFWKQYLIHEIQSDTDKDEVNKIWSKCLFKCHSIELWDFYLKHVESIGGLSEECFTLSLEKVGHDVKSGNIYLKYLQFLHMNSNDIKKIRDTYRRALDTPMDQLDKIWKMYEDFELQNTNSNVKSLLHEAKGRYQESVNKYQDKLKVRAGLLVNMLPVPLFKEQKMRENDGLGASLCTAYVESNKKLLMQKLIWKNVIACEMRNTQRLSQDVIKGRIIFQYNKCLSCLRYVPEVWYEFILYLKSQNDFDEAEKVYEKAVECLPDNIMLNFSYFEFLEVERGKKDLGVEKFSAFFDRVREPIVFVNLLKYLERVKGIKEVRIFFVKYFRDKSLKKFLSYQVYVVMAYLEYRTTSTNPENRVKLARKIFQNGLKTFGKNPKFLLEYVKFLELVGDIDGLRTMFERVFSNPDIYAKKVFLDGPNNDGPNNISNAPKGGASEDFFELFNKYLSFEYEHGDRSTIDHVEKKYFELYPQFAYKSPLKSLARKYSFLDLYPCDEEDMKFLDEIVEPKEKSFRKPILEINLSKNSDFVSENENIIVEPDTSDMIEVNNKELENIIHNPKAFEILNEPTIPAVATLISKIPQKLKGEHLPNVSVVIETLTKGPLPSFGILNDSGSDEKNVIENSSDNSKGNGENEIDEEEIVRRMENSNGNGDDSGGNDRKRDRDRDLLSEEHDIYAKRRKMK